ncbi:hypothetical protein BC629DRAFT_1613108 [Irpex lacteus]|nr:hypothetical protein BC629DRAFT_1613108 [Irpex lacteus]
MEQRASRERAPSPPPPVPSGSSTGGNTAVFRPPVHQSSSSNNNIQAPTPRPTGRPPMALIPTSVGKARAPQLRRFDTFWVCDPTTQ